MTNDDDQVVWDTILGGLQDPSFRKWRIERYGRIIEMPNGCMGEIQDDGGVACIACAGPLSQHDEIGWITP